MIRLSPRRALVPELAEKLVKKLAKSLFVHHLPIITRKWTQYPENEEMGIYWNIENLLSTVWGKKMDVTLHGDYMQIFQNSKCTRIPLTLMCQDEQLCVRFMKENHSSFFKAVTSNIPVGSAPVFSKFIFNQLFEKYAARLEMVLCIVLRSLYSSLRENYLLMRDTVIVAIQNITMKKAFYDKNGGPLGKRSMDLDISPDHDAALIAFLKKIKTPHYKELWDFWEKEEALKKIKYVSFPRLESSFARTPSLATGKREMPVESEVAESPAILPCGPPTCDGADREGIHRQGGNHPPSSRKDTKKRPASYELSECTKNKKILHHPDLPGEFSVNNPLKANSESLKNTLQSCINSLQPTQKGPLTFAPRSSIIRI